MTWKSRVPAAIDALVALWSASPVLAGIVHDGPLPLDSADLEALTVGYDGGDNGTASEGTLVQAGMAVKPDREQFTVSCLIAVLNGAGNVRAARTRGFELLSAASEILASDKTLGGIALDASVQDVSLSQQQVADGGALVQILFTVAVDAFTEV